MTNEDAPMLAGSVEGQLEALKAWLSDENQGS